MPNLVRAGETDAAKRTVVFQVVGTDGITPANGEEGGQPQIRPVGGAWTSTGIGTMSWKDNGQYDAVLTEDAVGISNIGARYESRYKSASTAECPGDTTLVVAFDPYTDVGTILATLLSNVESIIAASIMPPTLSTPVAITRGDTYTAALNRNLWWNITTNLDLTTATAYLTVFYDEVEEHGQYDDFVCTMTAITDGYKISREFSNVESALFSKGSHRFKVRVTLPGDIVITEFYGKMNVTGYVA